MPEETRYSINKLEHKLGVLCRLPLQQTSSNIDNGLISLLTRNSPHKRLLFVWAGVVTMVCVPIVTIYTERHMCLCGLGGYGKYNTLQHLALFVVSEVDRTILTLAV